MAKWSKNWRPALGIFLGAAIFAIVASHQRGRPRYQGHTSDYYFPSWTSHQEWGNRANYLVLEPPKPEAIPMLVDALRSNAGHSRERLLEAFRSVPDSVSSCLPCPISEDENARDAERILAALAIGSESGLQLFVNKFGQIPALHRAALFARFGEDLNRVDDARRSFLRWPLNSDREIALLAAGQLTSDLRELRVSASSLLLLLGTRSEAALTNLINSIEQIASKSAPCENTAPNVFRLFGMFGRQASTAAPGLEAIQLNGPPHLRLLAGLAHCQVDPSRSPIDQFLRNLLATLDLANAKRLADVLAGEPIYFSFSEDAKATAVAALLDADVLNKYPAREPVDWNWDADDVPTDDKIRADILTSACNAARLLNGKSLSPAPQLAALLMDDDAWVSRSAADALMAIGPNAVETIPQLIHCLDSEPLADQMIELLGAYGRRASNAVPRLCEIARGEQMPTEISAKQKAAGSSQRPALTMPVGGHPPAERELIRWCPGPTPDYPEERTRLSARLAVIKIWGADLTME